LERQVNERQLSMLQWVEAGCPAGVWETRSYKITCQALQNRGLLTVSRKAGQWSVALTSTGQHYLAHGTYPPCGSRPRNTQAAASPPVHPSAENSGPRAEAQPSVTASRDVHGAAAARARGGRRQDRQKRQRSGLGEVAVPRRRGTQIRKGPGDEGAVRGLVPWRVRKIKLVDIPAWRLAVLEPVPVPARPTRPHTVVRAMRSEPQPLGLTKPVQGRTLRLVQAPIIAAEAAGHSSSAGQTGFAPPSHRRRRASPHFTITAQGQTVGLLVLQE
jgi:hypothetical protein